MKYYIIAGEASGDLHASNLMSGLKKPDGQAEFRCWGGDLIEKQGATLVKHYRDLAFMGFTEVLLNLGTILKNISLAKRDIVNYHPDVLILVDYPGFNLRMAKFAYERGIKVFYYISPQIWAWKKSRVKTIRKYVDRMFVILPFEKEFYRKYDVDVDFVGHSLLDAISNEQRKLGTREVFGKGYGLDERPIIALLPGSREQEIKKMLHVMLTIVPLYSRFQFVIAGAPSLSEDFYKIIIGDMDVKLVFDSTYDLLDKSHAALVTSGTATLETALMRVPEVVCYKGSTLSYQIARRLVHIKFISLVNLIMDRKVVEELIQAEMNPSRLKQELDKILEDKNRKRIFDDYAALRDKLGGNGASDYAAKLMVDLLQR